MTCQYGWQADTHCNAWGHPSPFHGCKLAEGHYGNCTCLCGDTRRMYPPDRRPNRTRRAAA